MARLKIFATVAALANYAAVLWHLDLVAKLQPEAPVAPSIRIAIIAGALTLAGLVLLWMRWHKTGSGVLAVMFANGLVIGSLEHFFVAGPFNVFDVGYGDWTLLFKISVAILVLCEVAGLSATGRMLVVRPAP
ncbi:MAG: hypothetical protein ACYDAE_17255 [Steroidobacteraceae bacterium]